MPNWKNAESKTKLMAAWLAATGTTPNYREIAKFFGENATYDAIEGQFRPLRKLAEKLKADVANGTTTVPVTGDGGGGAPAAVTTPKTPRARAAPAAAGGSGRKRGSTAKKDGVIGGRVVKPEPGAGAGAATPSRALAPKRENSVRGVKEEVVSSSDEPVTPTDPFFDAAAAAANGFGALPGDDDGVLDFSFVESVAHGDGSFNEAV